MLVRTQKVHLKLSMSKMFPFLFLFFWGGGGGDKGLLGYPASTATTSTANTRPLSQPSSPASHPSSGPREVSVLNTTCYCYGVTLKLHSVVWCVCNAPGRFFFSWTQVLTCLRGQHKSGYKAWQGKCIYIAHFIHRLKNWKQTIKLQNVHFLKEMCVIAASTAAAACGDLCVH